ncbi:MAG: hypothetical protein RI912_702 [Actinomycetota bacterium]|jgi:hypothetical protein
MKTRTPKKCPQCGKTTVLPIAYGMPGPELWEESRRGRVILGGCMIMPFNARHRCTSCDWDDSGVRGDEDDGFPRLTD